MDMNLSKFQELIMYREAWHTVVHGVTKGQTWLSYGIELKSYSQKTSQSNHTRTTALSNSMKLSHARGATQDGWVMVERSDRMWSTGEGNGKPLQYSCLENPLNSMKRQNNRILKEELPGQQVPNTLLEISGEITPERMKGWSQSKNNTQLWMLQ